MNASDIMTIGAILVHTDSTVTHAARMMVEHRISGLPVVDASGKLVGIVSEQDLLRREELGTAAPSWLDFCLDADGLAHEYARGFGRKVEDVMSRNVVSVEPEAHVGEVVELMETHHIKRIPVVRNGEVVGIVSRANMLSALARLMGEAPQPVVSDLTIRKSIFDEIAGKEWAPGNAIDVRVRDGVVTLNGTVEAEHIRDAVRVAAENAPGAVRVWDNIRVAKLTAD